MIQYKDEIDVKDYNALRTAVDWQPLEETQALAGLSGSAFKVVAFDIDNKTGVTKTVGITRVISDGGYMFLIADVMVLPQYQGSGIGREMMNRALDYCKSTLKDNQFILVNLMATKNREGFYEKFGFSKRPNEEKGPGMMMWLKK